MKDKISDIFLVLSNPRHKILFLLLLRSGAMISSKVLAEELSVTPRTIKSDSKSMRYDLGQFGIQIASKSSQGYRLVLRDQVQNRRMKEYFQIYQPIRSMMNRKSESITSYAVCFLPGSR